MKLAKRALVLGLLAFCPSAGASQEVARATGRFDLNVERSSVLRLGKIHVEAANAFAIYTDKFFNGRTKALEIHLYASPIDAAARRRLLKNERDDDELLKRGAAYVVFLLDRENRITQANVTIVVPGTTVTRTVAYTAADIAKWFSDYRYAGGRLHLASKGTYATGALPSDDRLTLAWELALDIPVVDRREQPRSPKLD